MTPQESKMQKLEKLLELLNQGVSKKDFVASFEAVLVYAKQLREQNTLELARIRQATLDFAAEMKNENTTDLSQLKKQINNFLSSQLKIMLEKQESILDFVNKQMAIVQNEVNEKETKINDVISKIPIIPPVMGVEIVNKINDLPTDENKYLIDIEHIDGLLDRLEKLRMSISNIPRGGGRSNNSTKFHDLSSQTNGSLKVFTVPKGVAAIVIGSDFPTVLMENNGFTINATRTQITLTTTDAPSSGSQLLYQYSSMFN